MYTTYKLINKAFTFRVLMLRHLYTIGRDKGLDCTTMPIS